MSSGLCQTNKTLEHNIASTIKAMESWCKIISSTKGVNKTLTDFSDFRCISLQSFLKFGSATLWQVIGISWLL